MAKQKIYKLKAEIIDRINTDADISAGVTKALGIAPTALTSAIQRNSRRLTEFPVLNFLSTALGRDMNELVEEANIETVPE